MSKKVIVLGDPTSADLVEVKNKFDDVEIIQTLDGLYTEQLKNTLDFELRDIVLDNFYPEVPKKLKGVKFESVRNSQKQPKYNRNEPCPCGSGKKYKHCCANRNL